VAPVHVPRLEGPWHEVHDHLARRGHVVVHTTWGQWLPALLTQPQLRTLLGRDWTRYRRTADPIVRHRFAAARLLLKYTAAAALRTPPAALDLAYRLGGRPYLRGFDQIDVSLTHTGDLMAVALSTIGRIGVDVEPADRQMPLDLLRSQMCTPGEVAELATFPAAEHRTQALRLWTLKEAYTKALGQGMRLGFTQFGFGLRSGALLTPDGADAGHGEWSFASHPVLGRYLLSVACQDAGLNPVGDTAVATMLDEGFLAAMAQYGGPA
jgi:4'-phosphopantetheinyl transferase